MTQPDSTVQYVAIVELGDETHATGVWFPDLPGCFSGGDTFTEAVNNAREAVRVHITALEADGLEAPTPRELVQLLEPLQKDIDNGKQIILFNVRYAPENGEV